MKKIIVGIFALTSLFVSSSAFASGWNTYPSDCPTPLTIGNYTTGVGIQNGSNGCWTMTSVSASAGQVINIAVFYDNTNGVNANNTTINLTQSPAGSMTNPSTSFSFSGNLNSSAGSLPLSTVTANITTSQTLTFGQAKWYKTGSNSSTPLPNGQTGFEAFNGGLSLGTINNADWGTVVFSFTVGSTINPQTCQDPNATNYGGALPCTYNTNLYCTISSFTANGNSSSITVPANSPVTISWTTQNCNSATTSGPGMTNDYRLVGSQTIYPNYSGTYNINAFGNNGNPTRSIYVNVNNYNYLTCQDPNATNYGGQLPCNYYNNYNYCTISTFTANGSNNVTVNSGQPVTIYWTTNNCNNVSITDLGNNLPTSGSRTVYPYNSMNYIINAYGYTGGNASQSVHVNVNPTILPPVYNSCAVTTLATNVTKTSAQLNGLVTNGSQGANAYFEYGTTVDMGSRTNTRFVNGQFNEVLSGLQQDTVYYFRSVADCNGGTSRGTIEIFSTLANQVVHPVVIQGTTVIGTHSPIMLKIEDRYQSIGIGDIVDYTVTYKNIGKSLLTKPVVQVIVPRGITITNSSAGTYSNDTNALTVPINDLRPGDEGVIYLQGHVDSISSNTAQIVTTAILVYTNPSGAQENAIAYVLNNPKTMVGQVESNSLGAAAFFLGLFPTTLLGWLLLIILILLIILLARRTSKRTYVAVPTPPHQTH